MLIKLNINKELSIFELWGIKKNGFKITKAYKHDLQDFPLIKKDYQMILKKKQKINTDLNDLDEFSKLIENDNKSNQDDIENKHRLSQESIESKCYEWHNYVYDQLDSSGDSGCPESEFEEIKSD